MSSVTFISSLVLFLAFLVLSGNAATTCSTISNPNSLPCVEIPSCSTTKTSSISINQLSTGLGPAKSTAAVNLCYNSNSLHLTVAATQQNYFSSRTFTSCNDAVYLVDVIELFIAPPCASHSSECDSYGNPYCYSEIDTAPKNEIFESGIYAPYLNHTSVQNYLIDCSSSGVTHTTQMASKAWSLDLTVPWDVVYNPQGCPKAAESDSSNKKFSVSPSAGTIFRANMYRVNELTSTTQCSSSTCEYLAWSPTLSNPPAFHEPKKFGYFVLV